MTTEEVHFDQGLEWVHPTTPLSEAEVEFLEMILTATVDTTRASNEWPEMEGLIIGVLVHTFNRDAKAIFESNEFPQFRFASLEDIRALSPEGKYVYVMGSDDPDKKHLDEQLLNAALIALTEFEQFTKLSA